MAERRTARTQAKPANGEEFSKDELQREMQQTRESLAVTVEDIRETVNDQYQTVKETVSGVLDFRELFKKEPLIWSLGSLSAGFALGYTMGYAHKETKSGKRKHSEMGAFTDSLVDELSTVGKSLVMPTLNLRIKELFGVDFSGLLQQIGNANGSDRSRRLTKRIGSVKSTKKRVGKSKKANGR